MAKVREVVEACIFEARGLRMLSAPVTWLVIDGGDEDVAGMPMLPEFFPKDLDERVISLMTFCSA